MSDSPKPAVVMPAPRRRLEATSTTERGAKRKTGFLTFLLAILVAAGLLALIGWQAAPWLLQNQKQAESAETPAAKPPAPAPVQPNAQPNPQPATQPTQPAPPSTAPSVPADQADAKPSPMPPPSSAPAAAPAEQAPTPPVAEPPVQPAPKEERVVRKVSPPKEEPVVHKTPSRASTQPVTVISSPGGATAELDGRSETGCTTPCSIDASPGRHTLAITLPGYQIERREIDVGSGPQELPAIVLHAPGGTLMLTSVPSGAAILVDGKRISQTTPAQIPLSLGSHKVTVQMDGKESTQTVEIRAGISTLRIALRQ